MAERKTCYVCGNKINNDLDGVTKGQGIGHDQFRHPEKCAPGTLKWAQQYPDTFMAKMYWKLLAKEQEKKRRRRKNDQTGDGEEGGQRGCVGAEAEH